MNDADKVAFKEMLIAVFSIYNKPQPEKEMLRIWWHKLERFDFNTVGRAFDKWTDIPNKLPQPADIVTLCRPHDEVYKALPAPVNKIANKNHADEIVKFIENVSNVTKDTRDWAHKIIANPKRYPDISYRIAREALNIT